MAKKPMQDVFERNQYDLLTSVKRSTSWFNKQVSSLAQQNITPNQVIKGDPSQNTTTIQPGSLYMYAYDPKTTWDDKTRHENKNLTLPPKDTPPNGY